MTITNDAPILVYYDFLCPYAWRGLELAALLREERGLTFTLRHYSLVQGNHPENPNRAEPTWWLHQQPLTGEGLSGAHTGSLRAFLADQAAARQGEDARWRFVLTLFRQRHAQGQDLSDPNTIQAAATEAGLDAERFAADLQDDAGLRAALEGDLRAAATLKVFGTPTFQFPDGNAAYFRFAAPPTAQGAGVLWDLYTQVLTSDARVETIKRPR